jgi:type IV secretion system protein TrbL
MGNDVSIIDHFLAVFSQYIDSGFGLISGDVGFLVATLVGIDSTLAALAWALGEDDVIQAFAKKILYVGIFAFILNNWQSLTAAVFNSFAQLGLKASGSGLSYSTFLQPGQLAHAGVQAANVLLSQIQRLAGFPNVFWNLGEILVMGVSWIVTLIAFFVLAIMLFLAVIEFKLTTLKGFILVPFALWRGTSFIAEPVLGQVVTSGVRILTYAVVTGIGTQLFNQVLPTDPTMELSLQDALTILLASMTIAGLALSANRIASGIVSGAPQLGLSAAAAPTGLAAGTVVIGGGSAMMAGRVAASGVGAAASLAGGTRTAYVLGSTTSGGSVRGGLSGVARAAAGAAARSPVRTGEQIIGNLKDRFASGSRAAWSATGGEPPAGSPSGNSLSSAGAPGWADRLRRQTIVRTAQRAIRESEGGGAGLRPKLGGDDV